MCSSQPKRNPAASPPDCGKPSLPGGQPECACGKRCGVLKVLWESRNWEVTERDNPADRFRCPHPHPQGSRACPQPCPQPMLGDRDAIRHTRERSPSGESLGPASTRGSLRRRSPGDCGLHFGSSARWLKSACRAGCSRAERPPGQAPHLGSSARWLKSACRAGRSRTEKPPGQAPHLGSSAPWSKSACLAGRSRTEKPPVRVWLSRRVPRRCRRRGHGRRSGPRPAYARTGRSGPAS